MKLTHREPIAFDLLEIEAELEISDKKYVPLKPLKTSHHLHGFVLKKECINKSTLLNSRKINGSALLRQIAGKPLVISFYSSEWQAHGLAHLKYLNLLNKEIKALGSKLLVVYSGEPNAALEELIWDNSLQLNFYFDADNEIAQQFGLFSDDSPAWDKYPGIEVNVPLLATYVIDPSHTVIFNYVDDQLQGPAASDGVLNAIQTSHLYESKKSA